jgi:hypothetical protein
LAYIALPLSFFIAVASALSTTIFILYRLRNRNTALILLSLDLAVVVLLPFALVSTIALSAIAVERLFFSALTFYLAIFAGYVLFPNMCERILLPLTSLYLLFTTLQSLLTSLDSSLELGLALLGYKLGDNITLGTIIGLFILVVLPPCRQIGSKLNALINSRRFNNARRTTSFRAINTVDTLHSKASDIEHKDQPNRPLKNGLRLLKRGEYRSCVEYCDMETERIIVSRLLELHLFKVDTPMTIEEQLSKLRLKGISVPEGRIIRLRRLRNTLTISSGEATPDQARMAINVLRAIARPNSELENDSSRSTKRK